MKKRIWEIDTLRGLAVIGMIIFHVFYILNYQNLTSYELFNGGWKTFGDVVRNTFFITVGMSLVLSWQRQTLTQQPRKAYYIRHIKRALFLILVGFLFTIISTQISPDRVIRFGVLSFIGTGILLILPLINRPALLALFAIAVVIIEGNWGQTWSHDSFLGYILGFYPRYLPSLDYFPLIPWISAIAFGGTIGHVLFSDSARQYPFWENIPHVIQPINFIGRNALIIYVFHIPVTMAFIWVWLRFS